MALFDVVLGNLLTLVILGVLYLSYQIFASYLLVCLYALLLSEALQRPKQILIRITRGLLGHSFSTGLLMLAVVGGLAAGLLVVLTLSLKDLVAAVQAVKVSLKSSISRESLQRLGVNASTLDALGVPQMLDSTLAYAQSHYAVMEAQHNTTLWWPMVADAISAVQTAGNESNASLASITEDTGLIDLRLLELSDAATKMWDSIKSMDLSMQELSMMLWGIVQKRQEDVMKAVMYIVQMGEVSLSFLQLFTSSIVNLVFFFSLTLSLLSCKKSVLHELVHGLCGSAGPVVEQQLRQVSEGVLFFPIVCYLGRYSYTLAVGWLLHLSFPFLLALLTLLVTLVPGASPYPWIASVPWVLKLVISGYFADFNLLLFGKAALLFVSQWQILAFLETAAAQRSFSIAPSWVTGLSIVCGFERFGLHAFFMAPLLVSLVILSFHLVSEAREEDHAEESKDAPKLQRTRSEPGHFKTKQAGFVGDASVSAKKFGSVLHHKIKAATVSAGRSD